MYQGNTNEKNTPCSDIQLYFQLLSGGINLYDTRKFEDTYNKTLLIAYINRRDVQTALNIPVYQKYETSGPLVYDYLKNDIFLSTSYVLKNLVEKKYQVLIYAGNYDTKDGPTGRFFFKIKGIDQYLHEMNLENYNKKPRVKTISN